MNDLGQVRTGNKTFEEKEIRSWMMKDMRQVRKKRVFWPCCNAFGYMPASRSNKMEHPEQGIDIKQFQRDHDIQDEERLREVLVAVD